MRQNRNRRNLQDRDSGFAEPFCEGLALSDYQSVFSILLYNQFFYEVKDLQGFQKQLLQRTQELQTKLIALAEMEKVFAEEGIETEMIRLGTKAMQAFLQRLFYSTHFEKNMKVGANLSLTVPAFAI